MAVEITSYEGVRVATGRAGKASFGIWSSKVTLIMEFGDGIAPVTTVDG